MSLGENNKAKRNELKLSQEYVAEQLGCQQAGCFKVGNRPSEPTAKNLTELAAIFQISLGDDARIVPGTRGGVRFHGRDLRPKSRRCAAVGLRNAPAGAVNPAPTNKFYVLAHPGRP